MRARSLIFRTIILLLVAGAAGCIDNAVDSGGSGCGTYNGRTVYSSPGGCYYINSTGKKEYVSSSFCDC